MQKFFCGQQQSGDNVWLIYLYSIIFFFSFILCLRLLIKWITYIDYFPLKQRSPLLCITLLFVLMISINIFPVQVIYYYFTLHSVNQQNIVFKAVYFGTRYIAYFIYVLRSIRICFAYNVEQNMRYSLVFRFFSKQIYFVLIVMALIFLRMIPAILYPNFYLTPIDLISTKDEQYYLLMYIKKLFEQFPWQIILVICLFLQRKIKQQYGIIRQIAAIIMLNILMTVLQFSIGLFQVYSLDKNYNQVVIKYACYQNIPPAQIIIMVHHFLMFIISIIVPLFDISYYHLLLPIQQGYDLDQNLKAFLLEPLCYRIFYNYLYVLQKNKKKSGQYMNYTQMMQFWSKITRFKLQQNQNPIQLVQYIKNLNEELFDKKLIQTLNQSFLQLNQQLLESDKQKLKNSINQTIEQLQNNVIEQISNVYKNYFRQTHAYTKLKQMMIENDKINTNLLMLNMILREQIQI